MLNGASASCRGAGAVGRRRRGVPRAQGASVTAVDRKPESELGPRRSRSGRSACGSSSARTAARPSWEASSSSSLPACPGSSRSWRRRARRHPGDRRDRAGVPAPAGEVAAITGTKGKSTTTARSARCCARPAATRASAATSARRSSGSSRLDRGHRVRVEVSSFQLEGTTSFSRAIAVWLNLSADHLDRHPTLDAYVAAKARIFANQRAEDWAVVNADDPGGARAGTPRARAPAAVPRHRRAARGGDGAFFAGDAARLRRDGAEETLFARATSRCRARHLHGDMLVAAAAARLMGAPAEAIARAVRGFRGVEHVLEHVATVDGVAYYNDSKATNVEAARRSLEAFDEPVVVILGGRYKGGDFGELTPSLRPTAVLSWRSAKRRNASQRSRGDSPSEPARSFREAVLKARSLARPGDVVLLAPACSSFDMFKDYAERGRAFKAEVRR
jgi:UDP-N-acetylmuramoylalanine--D-glutamate ligase